eukprot:1136740-Pelagomonas_calceolata.AAC.4
MRKLKDTRRRALKALDALEGVLLLALVQLSHSACSEHLESVQAIGQACRREGLFAPVRCSGYVECAGNYTTCTEIRRLQDKGRVQKMNILRGCGMIAFLDKIQWPLRFKLHTEMGKCSAKVAVSAPEFEAPTVNLATKM